MVGNRVYVAGIVLVALLVLPALAGASGSDQGRRLTGPFCINLTTGVVRSVALLHTGSCRPGEVRRAGVAVSAPRGERGEQGLQGVAGPGGPTGQGGPQGAAGAKGVDGAKGADGILGAVPKPVRGGLFRAQRQP